MALPQLTDEQRKEALAKAAEARKARAELKEQLKRGDISLKEVLAKASSDEIIGKTKVSALLESLPKVGKVKAKERSPRLAGCGAWVTVSVAPCWSVSVSLRTKTWLAITLIRAG